MPAQHLFMKKVVLHLKEKIEFPMLVHGKILLRNHNVAFEKSSFAEDKIKLFTSSESQHPFPYQRQGPFAISHNAHAKQCFNCLFSLCKLLAKENQYHFFDNHFILEPLSPFIF